MCWNELVVPCFFFPFFFGDDFDFLSVFVGSCFVWFGLVCFGLFCLFVGSVLLCGFVFDFAFSLCFACCQKNTEAMTLCRGGMGDSKKH